MVENTHKKVKYNMKVFPIRISKELYNYIKLIILLFEVKIQYHKWTINNHKKHFFLGKQSPVEEQIKIQIKNHFTRGCLIMNIFN